MSRDSVVADKSRKFAYRIVDLYKYLTTVKQEFVMSKQILRSGTSIAANIAEGECAESKADFFHKLNIALKETNETMLWLDLLRYGSYISDREFQSVNDDCTEIIKILTAITKQQKSDN